MSPSGPGGPGARRCGQAVHRQWAESPSSLHGRLLRLSRLRRERGSVDVVLPASSRFERRETEQQHAIIGPDVHRTFAEAVAWDNGKLKRLGRVDMRCHPLDAFAKKLIKEDVVVVEATGNAALVAAVIPPHVKKVVIANPKQVRIIAHAKIKIDTIDGKVLAQLYASGFLPEVWIPDEPTQALRRQVTRRNQIVRQRSRLKNILPAEDGV
jgi:Transposase